MGTFVVSSCVSLNMFLQVAFLDESVAANVALPWFLAPVEHEVVFQIGFLDKSLSTQMASEII